MDTNIKQELVPNPDPYAAANSEDLRKRRNEHTQDELKNGDHMQMFPVLCSQNDVILVVSDAGWQCKRCNTEQLFWGQETIVDHLRHKHSIDAEAGCKIKSSKTRSSKKENQEANDKAACVQEVDHLELPAPGDINSKSSADTVENNGRKLAKIVAKVVCTDKTNSEDGNRTTQSESGKKKILCSVCHAEFKFYSQRIRHVKSVHRNPGSKAKARPLPAGKVIYCRFCRKEFISRATRLHHVRREHGGSEGKPYFCERCMQSFRYKNDLQLHVRKGECRQNHSVPQVKLGMLSEASNGDVQVPALSDAAERLQLKNGCKSHDITFQGVKESCPCKDCEAVFERKYQTQIHRWLVHIKDQNKPESSRVGKELSEKIASLMKQVEQRSDTFKKVYVNHDTEPTINFFCEICDGMVREGVRVVIKHVWNHYIKPHKHALFADAPELFRVNADRMFLCTDCGEEFPDKVDAVSYHRLTRHDTADAYSSNLKCGICGSIFQTKSAKIMHEMMIHRPDSEGEREKEMIICDVRKNF